ncbi:MAG TPA: toll/interleukin-1 receptor domain-containing protein, partial [Longimicrobium sp.]
MNQLRNDLQVILQVQQPGGGYNCEGFSGVATVFPAQVVLQAVASRTAELAELAAALRRTLMDLTPLSRAGQTPCQGGPIPDASFCHAHRVAGCQKVLVLVGDEKGDFPDHAVDAWLTGGDNYRVLPVFPADADLSSLEKRNAELAKINAAFWSRSITEIIPTVLSTAAVTSDDFRIFISYKRLDSLPLAHQLFGALTEAGFDVFMDRFSIEPAVNFQVRLTQEMADKSMLVLLESAQLAQSPWTQLEIA